MAGGSGGGINRRRSGAELTRPVLAGVAVISARPVVVLE